MPGGIDHQLHHQHAVEVAMRLGHAHTGLAQLVQRIDLGVLPGRFLLLAAVLAGLADRARLAAAAHLATFLVLHALLEAALGHVLVHLGAADLLARAHHVHGRLLAALERTHDGIDHAVVDQRLQACGSFHGTSEWKSRFDARWKTRIGVIRHAGVRERYTAPPLFPWCRGMSDPVRLARRVAELARCSRAEAEQYVQGGWVKVDGRVVEEPQLMVTGEAIEIDHAARLQANEPATILLHKPAGLDACEGASPATALVSPATRWDGDASGVRLLQQHFQRLVPLFPLEREASGL